MDSAVKPTRRRRPRGSLTREQVVDTALEVADRAGLEALSMPALAQQLDCGVMTLYGYVQDKGDLLDAIALRGLADLRLPRPMPATTVDILVAWGRALRQTLLRHPSLPAIFLSRPVMGPGIFRGMEALLGALSRAGMPPTDGLPAIYAVLIYATGFVAWEVPRVLQQEPVAYAAGWRRAFAELPPAELPLTASVLDALPGVADAAQFERGLAALAGGLAGP